VFEQVRGPKETFVLTPPSVSSYVPAIECYCGSTFGLGGSCFALNHVFGLKAWDNFDAAWALSDVCPIIRRFVLRDFRKKDKWKKLMMYLENRMWPVWSLYGHFKANVISVIDV